MQRGVILYGPPAAGKDTVDRALCDLSPQYLHFERLKVGPGRTVGYRMADASVLQDMRAHGAIVWENTRYEATYVVDRPGLLDAFDRGVPIVHLGQPAAVEAVTAAFPDVSWTVVSLTCPEPIARERLKMRGNTDLEARIDAWRQTPPLPEADVWIDTSRERPEEAARLIQWAGAGVAGRRSN